jgi:DNA helicase II / ATP-dependent DNA helicase PcrA
MAIGDDDQTIYEWRGADPSFILNFAKRYKATTYFISDNFRCPAAPLLLANKVIGHNKKRQRKRLSLTRGFYGDTAVTLAPTVATMSRRIVDRIVELHRPTVPLNDMAVLVRLNAQTPYIEQFLIEEKLPYRVSQPFYERAEIKTLIEYGRLAWFEQQLQSGSNPGPTRATGWPSATPGAPSATGPSAT